MNLAQIPSSVYRLQLGKTCTLADATSLLPYLAALGIEGVYCSPLFEHVDDNPYEITNPNCPSEKLGGVEAFTLFCSSLRQQGILHLLDLVPNHMGFRGGGNSWWQDVMAQGEASPFASFFDIDWRPSNPLLNHKILLPLLQESYGEALENQALSLIYDGQYQIAYADYRLPLSHETARELERGSPEAVLEEHRGRAGEPRSFDKLHLLLERQFYRLAHWRIAGQEINYRRFFNINELVAIHTEEERVLAAHHAWVFDLIERGDVQGLRIDHPDGLYDPARYFARLKSRNPGFIVVEKILDFGEKLPDDWAVDGTVGYDYLALVNGLFVQKKNERALTRIYEKFIGRKVALKPLLHERRRRYIAEQMGSVVQMLGALLYKIAQKNRHTRDFTQADLMRVIQETIACFPVYRTYLCPGMTARHRDVDYVAQAIEMAKNTTPEVDASVFDYLKGILLNTEGEEDPLAIDFSLRFQQITAPTMAKGLEDSTFYLYNRLISLNEVGGNPEHFGHARPVFFSYNKEQLTKGRISLLPSSTHDTKYSEDVRMRLNAISEIPERWQEAVLAWKRENRRHKTLVKGKPAPDLNAEYYLYQMLIGAWAEDPDALLRTRLKDSFLKTLREAGVHTSWRRPDEEYERAALTFLEAILQEEPDNHFLPSFLSLQKELALLGLWNSLSALLLRIGSVGIVDLYQGCESMAYSLVDPDNRRPVDFDKLKTQLADIQGEELTQLLRHPLDGKLKHYLTAKALQFRRAHKALFLEGDFLPIESTSEQLIGFVRAHKGQHVVILARRFFAERPEKSLEEERLQLPRDFPLSPLKELFSGREVSVQIRGKHPTLILADAVGALPCALLYS